MSEVKRPVAPDFLLRGAAASFYVARPYDASQHSRPGVRAMKCARCQGLVAVWGPTFDDRSVQHSLAGSTLVVVCDDCLPAAAEEHETLIFLPPGGDEVKEAAG